MRLFILRENAKHYRRMLDRVQSDADRRTVRRLLAATEAELADLERASARHHILNGIGSKAVVEAALDHVIHVRRARSAILHYHEASTHTLLAMAQRNLSPALLERFALVRAGDGSSCGRCLASGGGVCIDDVLDDPQFDTHRDIAEATGFRAMQSTPLRDGGGNLRAVLTTFFAEPRRFTAGDRAAMDSEASRLAPIFEQVMRDSGLPS